MGDSRFGNKPRDRIPENTDLNDEQRFFLLEHAMMAAQNVLLNRFGSAGYLGLCQNAADHPGVSHPHWDWEYLRTLTSPNRKETTVEYTNDEVALWCSIGGHAFSALDPGQQRVTVDQWDEESQRMAPMRVRACGEHARPVVTTTRPKKELTQAPVEDGKYLVDKESWERYIAALEKEALDTLD